MENETEKNLPVRQIKYASDCEPCPYCEEPWCDECNDHYADCDCLGPDSEETENSNGE